jgi:hypothetical protein
MATYLDMIARIADESLRPDLSDQIKLCIQDAIAHYEVERFWFNQFRDRTFATVAGQEFYGVADHSDIPNVLEFDAATLTIGSTRWPLAKTGYVQLENWNVDASSRGQPTHYAYWGEQIRLHPVPDGIYQIRLSGLFKLPALAADSDENAWTNDAEELIRHRAKSILYSQYLRDDGNAARAAALESAAHERLTTTAARRLAAGDIRPSL